MKHKLKITLIFFCLIFYWSSTIFFTIPENYLQIKGIRYERLFSSLFYQKWSFFAPPPKHNERLYYEFVSNKKDTLTIEVLEKINNERKKTYLKNDELSIIDYVLSNTISNITDIIRDNYNNYKFKSCDEKSEDNCFASFMNSFGDEMHMLGELKTLNNYGNQILEKHNYLGKYDKFKIISTNIPINKFSKRYENSISDEIFIFSTRYFNLKNNLWEKSPN
jgi:hypothetical protein